MNAPSPAQMPMNNQIPVGMQANKMQAINYQNPGMPGMIYQQPGMIIQQPYLSNQPIIAVPVQNQYAPSYSSFEIDRWGTKPHPCVCPVCRKQITTNVLTNLNCMSCLACCYLGCCIYACIQCFMGKEIGCSDGVHSCPKCGSTIGIYRSCS